MNQVYKELTVYQQARTIAEVTEALVESFDEEGVQDICNQLIRFAKTLPEKIAAAECGDFYTLRLENAFYVKCAARELQSLLLYCMALKLTDKDYINFLCKELDTFRELFLNWVATFNKHNDLKDEWFFEV